MKVLFRVAGTAPRVLQLFIFTVEPTMLSTRSPNLTSNSNYEPFELFWKPGFFQVWVRDALHDPRNLPPSRGLTWWALRGFNGRPLLGLFLVFLVQPSHLHLLNKSASTKSYAFKLSHLRFHCWSGSKIDQKISDTLALLLRLHKNCQL